MTQPFIRIRNLHKSYQDVEGRPLNILKGVNLDVAAAATVAITGASGVGKSTLLHLLGALDQPAEGAITVGGRELAAMGQEEAARFRNKTIGFVFQFHHLLSDFTALENVMMPWWIEAGKTLPKEKEALALLDEVGLAGRASHKPAQLSGGELQRVAIARAIANRPPLLLADEPTGNLDEETGGQVESLLMDLNKNHQLTLILVTHNRQFASRMESRFVLEHGQLHPESQPSR